MKLRLSLKLNSSVIAENMPDIDPSTPGAIL